jgi:DNA-binding MarR family transcriptional regulator
VENWTNDIIGASERRLLIRKSILSFKSLLWELRNDKSDHKLTNLSVYVLLYLKENESVLRTDIMKALKSNYHDISEAIDLLTSKNYVTYDEVPINRLNNKISVKSKWFRLNIYGDIFICELIEKLF